MNPWLAFALGAVVGVIAYRAAVSTAIAEATSDPLGLGLEE